MKKATKENWKFILNVCMSFFTLIIAVTGIWAVHQTQKLIIDSKTPDLALDVKLNAIPNRDYGDRHQVSADIFLPNPSSSLTIGNVGQIPAYLKDIVLSGSCLFESDSKQLFVKQISMVLAVGETYPTTFNVTNIQVGKIPCEVKIVVDVADTQLVHTIEITSPTKEFNYTDIKGGLVRYASQ